MAARHKIVPPRPGEPIEKICLRCGAIKPIGFFYRDSGRRDGRMDWCTLCEQTRYRTERKPQRIVRRMHERYLRSRRSGILGLRGYRRNRLPYESLLPEQRRSAEERELQKIDRYFLSHHRQPNGRKVGQIRGGITASIGRVRSLSWHQEMSAYHGHARRQEREAVIARMRADRADKTGERPELPESDRIPPILGL